VFDIDLIAVSIVLVVAAGQRKSDETRQHRRLGSAETVEALLTAEAGGVDVVEFGAVADLDLGVVGLLGGLELIGRDGSNKLLTFSGQGFSMVELLDLLACLDPAFGSLLKKLSDVLVGEEGRLVG